MSVDETLMCSFQVCFVVRAALVSVNICAISLICNSCMNLWAQIVTLLLGQQTVT